SFNSKETSIQAPRTRSNIQENGGEDQQRILQAKGHSRERVLRPSESPEAAPSKHRSFCLCFLYLYVLHTPLINGPKR
ncbi:unnamed protein product, partial [Brassica oleracea var. botrytis]